MKLPLIVSLSLTLLTACGVTSTDPSTSEPCAKKACGCMPVECGNGACCPTEQVCVTRADGKPGCDPPPWQGPPTAKRVGDAGTDGGRP